MGSRHVLIIEDDKDIQHYLQAVLEHEGFQVLLADNGQEGLQILNHGGHPGLIILDLTMPVMGGEKFLEVQRCNPNYGSLPVIAITGVKDRKRPSQADEFLRKPIEIETLLSMVHKYSDDSQS